MLFCALDGTHSAAHQQWAATQDKLRHCRRSDSASAVRIVAAVPVRRAHRFRSKHGALGYEASGRLIGTLHRAAGVHRVLLRGPDGQAVPQRSQGVLQVVLEHRLSGISMP